MNSTGDVDPDLDIPEFDFDRAHRVDRSAAGPDETVEIRIDGAVAYAIRLIPSNKVIGTFASTVQAWPAVLAEIDRGTPARCLVLDAHLDNGERHKVAAGSLLASAARRHSGRRGLPTAAAS